MAISGPLSGIIPPLITPLNSDFTLDKQSLQKLLEHVIFGGVHGVFILGTTGEFSSLTRETKIDLIKETTRIIDGRITVLVGISDCSFGESLLMAKEAFQAGADAVVATTPFYLNVNQDELIGYFKKLANTIELPLFLYNMPGNTHKHIAPETVASLAKHPNIIGIKDSSGDLNTFAAYRSALLKHPDFSLLVGPEEILDKTLDMGGNGGVTGGANLFPKLYVSLYEAFHNGDDLKVKELQSKIHFLSENLYQNNTYASSYLKGLKAALSFEGLCQGHLALPLFPYTDLEKESLFQKFQAVKKRVEIE